MALLQIDGVETFYQQSQALFGVTFSIDKGEVVSLLGRNGMGKTTTIRSILGMTPPRQGSVYFAQQNVKGWPSFRIAQLGIGLVPEGRQVFPTLTVGENLLATAANRLNRPQKWNLSRVFDLFPRLLERKNQFAAALSGGEQQMLAIGRALMTNPQLLILDEATEGLAPLIREEIWRCLTTLKSDSMSILIVDKDIHALQKISDRHVILEKGWTVWQGNSRELNSDPGVIQKYLGV